jgi:hypothetical protein
MVATVSSDHSKDSQIPRSSVIASPMVPAAMTSAISSASWRRRRRKARTSVALAHQWWYGSRAMILCARKSCSSRTTRASW